MPVARRFCLVLFALSIGLLAASSDSRAATSNVLLWDTGAPQEFYNLSASTLENYWGYSCGSLTTENSGPPTNEPQLRLASPFEITGGSATLTQVNADWDMTSDTNSGGQEVIYTIYQRTGLNAPGAVVSSGVLGLYSTATGIDDPRIPLTNQALHEYTVNIPLPAGNYYLSIASSGAGIDGSDNKLAWLGGANLQPADLEWNGAWRSYVLPSPGFFALTPASTNSGVASLASTIMPGQSMSDPLNRWDVSFALIGTTQYNTLVWVGTGGNTSWSTTGNWGGTAPSSSAVLEFGPLAVGGSAVNNNNIAAGTRFQAISFLPAAPAYQLSGNSISLGGNVGNLSSSSQTINLALALVASGISVDTGAAGLSVDGNVSGSGGITKLGSGELILSGSNTYAGGTIVSDGVLDIAGKTSLPSGSVTVGSQATLPFLEAAEGLAAGSLGEMSGTAAYQADAAGVASPTSIPSTVSPVPEPSTALLAVAAGLVIALTRLLVRKSVAPLRLPLGKEAT